MATSQPKAEAKGEPTEVEEIAQTALEYRIWVLKTNIHCDGCRKKIHRTLKSMDGVYRIEVDVMLQKVTVIGNVDAEALIKKLAKEGKPSELWPGQNANCSPPNDKKKSKGKGKQKGSPESSEDSNHGSPDGFCDGEKETVNDEAVQVVGSGVKNNGGVNGTSKNSGRGTAPAKNGGGGGQPAKNGGGGGQPAKNGGGGGAPVNNGGGGPPAKNGGGGAPVNNGGSGPPAKNGGGGAPAKNSGGGAPVNNRDGSGASAKNGGGGGASAKNGGGGAPAKNGGGGPMKNGVGGGGATGNNGGGGSGLGKNVGGGAAPDKSGGGGGQVANQSTIAEEVEDTDSDSDWEDEESGGGGRANGSGGNNKKKWGPNGNGNVDEDNVEDEQYDGAPPNTETAIVPNGFRMLPGPNGPPGPSGAPCFLGPQGLRAPYGPLGPNPAQAPANINPPRQNVHEYQYYPRQPYFGPPVGPFPGSHNNAAIPAGYGASHYDASPPFSQSYSYEPSRLQAGNEPQSYAPQEFYPSQAPHARPSDSFHFFSDENPNGCTVM